MNKFVKGLSVACVGAIALCATSVTSNAGVIYDSSVDKYIGGIGVGVSNPTNDVVGALSKYDTTRAVVEKTDGDDLKVRIYSNYMNNIGSDGTSLGALFIGDATDPLNLILNSDNTGDTFAADPTRFQYAVEFDGNRPGSGTTVASGAAKVYSINGAGDVIQSDDVTSGGFRGDQAVRPSNSANEATGTAGTASWSLDADQPGEGNNYLEFVIQDYFINTNINANVRTTDFVFAWAMSCANDVWMDIVTIPGGANPVPLPAGFVLLLSGLLGLGWLGRSRTKQA